jgi:farnesyl-diphosphate farnesyltransferase
MSCTNPRDVAYLFRDYARKIHLKASPLDPNFLRISIACGKVSLPRVANNQPRVSRLFLQIEAWCEQQYPSFVQLNQSGASGDISKSFDPTDARTRIQQLELIREKEIALQSKGVDPVKLAEQEAASNKEVMTLVGTIMVIVVGVCLLIVYITVTVANRYSLP